MLITKIGKQKLEQKIKELKIDLDKTSRERGEAAREGDLKENSAYIFLGERADVLRTQVQELLVDLKQAEIAPIPTQTEVVSFGHQLTIKFEQDGRQMTFTLVGKNDSPLKTDWLSIDSPIGQALINKHKGDRVEVNSQLVTLVDISLADLSL